MKHKPFYDCPIDPSERRRAGFYCDWCGEDGNCGLAGRSTDESDCECPEGLGYVDEDGLFWPA